jgi:hypothetical protein
MNGMISLCGVGGGTAVTVLTLAIADDAAEQRACEQPKQPADHGDGFIGNDS